MGAMSEHKIQYRGFPVPDGFLGTPSMLLGSSGLVAWKLGIDTVLDSYQAPPEPLKWTVTGYTPEPVTVSIDSYLKAPVETLLKGSVYAAPLPKYQPLPEIEDGYQYYSREQGHGRKTTYYRVKTTDQKEDVWTDVVDTRYEDVGPPRIKTEWLTWPYLRDSDAVGVKRSAVPVDFRMPGFNSTRYNLIATPHTDDGGWFILDGTDRVVYRWKAGFEDSAFTVTNLRGSSFEQVGRDYIDPSEFGTW